MTKADRIELSEIEQRVCDIASEQLGVERNQISPTSRVIEDLNCDSLDFVELIMTMEDEFDVTIPDKPNNAVAKTLFTRRPFRLSDLAETVYLYQGSGKPTRKWLRKTNERDPDDSNAHFTQLGGCWRRDSSQPPIPFWEPLPTETKTKQFRRRSDGMRCCLLATEETTIGSDEPDALPDEQPSHAVRLDAFLIDAEPVSTTAYCRFLNSIDANEANFRDWFLLDSDDDRTTQLPIVPSLTGWRPVVGVETLPMVLVSWFGANAYSLWANDSNWNAYDTDQEFLPTEAQWEFAAQGAYQAPSANNPESEEATFIFGRHQPGAEYQANTMPMAPVHVPLGVSSFGLNHMAGNVWQWCRDWFAEDFYHRPDSRGTNPVNKLETGIRSERGGSWVGPVELCRTTYRRGRNPNARGRCLGFRCVSPVSQ